jgi:hypothetical protein
MIDALDILNDLSTDELKNTNTAFPNLAPSQYEFKIDSAEIKDSQSGGKYLLFQTKLNSPDAMSTAGEPLAVGFPVRHMINLSPSQDQIDKHGEEGCKKNIKKDIAKFLEAVVGPERTWDPTLELYVGQTFFAKTRVSPERTDKKTGITYDPSTEFASFIPKTESFDAAAVAAEHRDSNSY